MADAVGKLPTGTDSNKKDKLDYAIDSRSMRMIEDKDRGTAKVHCLVAKALNMSPDLDDCSVCHRGLGRLVCARHVGQDSRARGAPTQTEGSSIKQALVHMRAHCALTNGQVRVMPPRHTSSRSLPLGGAPRELTDLRATGLNSTPRKEGLSSLSLTLLGPCWKTTEKQPKIFFFVGDCLKPFVEDGTCNPFMPVQSKHTSYT